MQLTSPHFSLALSLQVFQSELSAIITATLESDGFSAVSDMDTDIRALCMFTDALTQLYETLHGTASLKEPFGHQQHITFTGDGKGHIHICGQLTGCRHSGFLQTLAFQNTIDQTYLPAFIRQLNEACRPYREACQ